MTSITSELASEERANLIRRLSLVPGLKYLDSATHAMLWLGDIEKLKVTNLLSTFTESCLYKPTLKAWLARSQRRNEPPQPTDLVSPTAAPNTPQKRNFRDSSRSPSKPPRLKKRSNPAKDIVNERDGGRCVITKMSEPIQVCHIYPFALGSKPKSERESFWRLLGCFWTSETIAKWKESIIHSEDIDIPPNSEAPQNVLCLSTIVHVLWASARLAFEPVKLSEDQTSLTMRFWWLPLRTFSKHVDLRVAPFLPSDLRASPLNAKLWNRETDEPIYSGHLMTLTTRDPESMPLPSFDLLQMQWTLNRIAALAGAADVIDEEFEPDFES
ncbi:HNH endonuclease signature motif containing protein [Aspergillus ibericus CBS 121593]|uniref:HNH nuclease domain-containing protein n=1 Tax=Aspergillus ibericus CBS 121593 TaxID=1448316 RepID=A0A395HAE0_9EURO|nr:hypothetical protein BO80DRAFT_452550 [Aspergillus ibericus CBS 121593]RAL04463.1 hypothetical protein BO80DRAFT_452550 [Aspergillus ibericus CBS 121593]